jgi:hypothetical protein
MRSVLPAHGTRRQRHDVVSRRTRQRLSLLIHAETYPRGDRLTSIARRCNVDGKTVAMQTAAIGVRLIHVCRQCSAARSTCQSVRILLFCRQHL